MPELGPAPSSVYAPPETRNEVERPTASPAASHPSAAMLPFHLCDSHFPNDPWPHISLKEARCCFQPVPTAHFCPLFKGPLFHHSLCPLLPSGGNSVTHIAWNEDHRPSLYKLLIENHVRNGRKRRGGGDNNPWQNPSYCEQQRTLLEGQALFHLSHISLSFQLQDLRMGALGDNVRQIRKGYKDAAKGPPDPCPTLRLTCSMSTGYLQLWRQASWVKAWPFHFQLCDPRQVTWPLWALVSCSVKWG